MSNLPTDPLRQEHLELLPRLHDLQQAAVEVSRWSASEAGEHLTELLEFLEHHLVPHALAEDEILYPAIDQALGAPGSTGTMRADHDEVVARIARLRRTVVSTLTEWENRDRVMDVSLQVAGLAAIVLLHFRKEEEVLLPILDSVLTTEEAEALFAAMGEAAHPHPQHS